MSGNFRYIYNLESRRLPKTIGNKAQNLLELSKIGVSIPKTKVLTWQAYQRYIQDDEELVGELHVELKNHSSSDSRPYFYITELDELQPYSTIPITNWLVDHELLWQRNMSYGGFAPELDHPF